MDIDGIKKEMLSEFREDALRMTADVSEFVSVATVDCTFQTLKGLFTRLGDKNYTLSEILGLLDIAYIESRTTISTKLKKEMIEKNIAVVCKE